MPPAAPLMILEDVVRVGLEALRRSRLRTALSVIGIVVGVAAVVAMLSVGEGARESALQQLSALGLDNIIVRASTPSAGDSVAPPGRSRGLTVADAQHLMTLLPGIEGAAPVSHRFATLQWGRATRTTLVMGVTPDYQWIRRLAPAAGRLLAPLDDQSSTRVCVLGGLLAQELFGSGQAVGAEVRIDGSWFQVVGVLGAGTDARPSTADNLPNLDIGDAVMVPLGTLWPSARRGPEASAHQIWVRARRGVDPSQLSGLLESTFEALHAGVDDVERFVPSELLEVRVRTQRTFNIVLAVVAALSLLVGGIGVANVMLASVLERIEEIGLRRSVGATRQWILWQFMAESTTMAVAGGLLGLAGGVLASLLISWWAQWPTHVSARAVGLALLMAAGTGLASGIYPAYRAAHLPPIRAVQYE